MGFMDVCITLILKGGNGTYVNSNANTKKHICMPILRILCEIIFIDLHGGKCILCMILYGILIYLKFTKL